jgi:hypothetical protein
MRVSWTNSSWRGIPITTAFITAVTFRVLLAEIHIAMSDDCEVQNSSSSLHDLQSQITSEIK